MEMKELNEKINGWAGTLDVEYTHPKFGIAYCFKWVVPKLVEGVDGDSLEISVLARTRECNFWVVQITNRRVTIGRASAETPALAFCLAVEKLINGEDK